MKTPNRMVICIFLFAFTITFISIPTAFASSNKTNHTITINYPNGDWGFTSVEIDIVGNKDNMYLFALKQLIEPQQLPTGCYDEFPSGFEINSIEIINDSAYLDVSDKVLQESGLSAGWIDSLRDIISYNIFNFDDNIKSIRFSSNGKPTSILKDIQKNVLFTQSRPYANDINTIDIDTSKLKDLTADERKAIVQKIIDDATGATNGTTRDGSNSYKVCIDPGHGGTDPGAVVGSTYEKNLNLPIALAARNRINFIHTVYMTRTTDVAVSLTARHELAKNNNVDLFVSVHCNTASNTSARGCTARYPNNHDEGSSEFLGNCLIDGVVDQSSMPKHSDASYQSIQVIRNCSMPAALVECGFMTNTSDLSILNQEQTDIGIGLGDGILQYCYFL